MGNFSEEMDAAGVDVAVMSSSSMIEGLPRSEAIRLAQLSNNRLYDMTTNFPGRILGTATATISPTTPGLYYWIVGGTEVGAVTNAGVGVLSTNGCAVELSKPALDVTAGKAFFKISAGVLAPAP